MWEKEPPNVVAHLRQGDLLADVPLPTLHDAPDVIQGRANFKIRTRHCVVVSQCCTVAQRKSVQVAWVNKTSPLRPEHPVYQGLISEWPAHPGAIFYDGMRLEPLVDVLEPLGDTRLWFADFRTGVTFANDPSWLLSHLRARMTVVARRTLRLRLAGFYARATREDRAELEAAGEWSGFGDAPPWVTLGGTEQA